MPKAGRLHLSKDRKVSPVGHYAGVLPDGRDRGFVASLENSFGLPAADSCPGMTAFCNACYALGAEEYRTAVARAMRHNLDLLTEAGTVEGMRDLIVEALGRFDRAFDRRLEAGQVAERDRVFRIHWDGDFFSTDYALAWKAAIRQYPRVQFWAYTRSFVPECNVVPILTGIDNLVLFLSTDEYNAPLARQVKAAWPEVRLALCAVDYHTARQLGAAKRRIICPENTGKLELMDDRGRGACVECRLCLRGTSDIIFSTSHQEDLDRGQERLFGNEVAVAIR